MHDKELINRCDVDEDYLLEEASATTHIQGGENPDGENEETMNNTIRNRIDDTLVNAREKQIMTKEVPHEPVDSKFGTMNLADHDTLRPGSSAFLRCRFYFRGLWRACQFDL